MADTAKPTAESTEQQPQQMPPLVVNGQYIKDLSFEIPGAPGIFSQLTQAPDIPIQVDIRINKLAENAFEVILKIKIDATFQGKPVFILELDYAGVFTVNAPPEHLEPLLTIEAARLLFPFARSIVADLTRDGGLPPLVMQPVDFVQVYRSRLEQQAAQAGSPVGHA